MATEKSYSGIEEAHTMIASLCEKYPDELWQIKPGIINVLGIENKERSKKNKKLATIRAIKNPTKAILQINNVAVRYVIELYWSDWNQWSTPLKQWIIFHELLHIGDDIGKLVKHDSEDFRMILDVVGVDWPAKDTKLPNLLGGEKVKFDLALRPIVAEYCQENEAKDDEIKNTKKAKNTKDAEDAKGAKDAGDNVNTDKVNDEVDEIEDAEDEDAEDNEGEALFE